MVEIPSDGDVLRDRTGKPIVRIVGWIGARDGQFKVPANCLREPDIPKSAVMVQVLFFDAVTRRVFGMGETPPKPSKGTRGISRDELGQFSVKC